MIYARVVPATRPLPRVLIVDDQPEIARALARVFAGEAEITVATSGVEALACFGRGTTFELVLCDVMMPGMTGPQLFAKVKALEPQAAAAFVFTTGGVDADHQRELQATGARCLAKPVDIAALRNLLPARKAEKEG